MNKITGIIRNILYAENAFALFFVIIFNRFLIIIILLFMYEYAL
jgi:hypothetical protein